MEDMFGRCTMCGDDYELCNGMCPYWPCWGCSRVIYDLDLEGGYCIACEARYAEVIRAISAVAEHVLERSRLCPGCRAFDGEHDFGPNCTLERET